MSSKTRAVPGLAIGFVFIAGCVGDPPTELQDPAAELGGTEWLDEGPPAGEEATSSTTEEALTDAPLFQVPFPCNQVWAGQTRTNHSPTNSVDFNRSGDEGDTVVAAAAGKVTRVDNEGNVSYGRWIEIDHGNGYRTRYAHLSAQVVSVGQSVTQGQKIGAVGNTGGSTGAHLHYELRRNGVAIRPVFNGATAFFYGTRNYTSKNKCDAGGTTGGGSASVSGTVNTAGAALTVRAKPSTDAASVGTVADGQKVTITCQINGSTVTGTYGTTSLWDFIGTGYVSDAYVNTGSDGQVAPTCK